MQTASIPAAEQQQNLIAQHTGHFYGRIVGSFGASQEFWVSGMLAPPHAARHGMEARLVCFHFNGTAAVEAQITSQSARELAAALIAAADAVEAL